MARNKKGSRLYWRGNRAWADFRDFSDVGGSQEPLVAAAERYATKDEEVAYDLLRRRHKELKRLRNSPDVVAKEPDAFEPFAIHHLRKKARKAAPSTIQRDEYSLEHVLVFLETLHPVPMVSHVTVATMDAYIDARQAQGAADQTLLNELHAVSSLMRRAVVEGMDVVNPIPLLLDKPGGPDPSSERVYLEIDEAARLLEGARRRDSNIKSSRGLKAHEALFATFLLTGARKTEILGQSESPRRLAYPGLRLKDIDWQRGQIWITSVKRKRGTVKRSRRWIPLWPQLRRILQEHVERFDIQDPDALLFANHYGKHWGNVDDALRTCVTGAGIEKHVTLHTFRHTYTAARLQTLDRGEPVAVYTVARELDHGSPSMLERVYSHLLRSHHRSKHVEYRKTEIIPISAVKAQ